MYLFQLRAERRKRQKVEIYIPLCIYFNLPASKSIDIDLMIYIPLCIYFNK